MHLESSNGRQVDISRDLRGTSAAGYNIMKELVALNPALFGGLSFLKVGLSDIAVVLMAGGLIEQFLRLSLISGFRADAVSNTMVASVFEGKGPLATFSAKIDVCAGLGIIRGDVRHDLKIINKVRNEFAHSPIELRLKDFPACLSLKVRTELSIEDDCKHRLIFKQSCAGIVPNLNTGMLTKIAEARVLAANASAVEAEYRSMVSAGDSAAERAE